MTDYKVALRRCYISEYDKHPIVAIVDSRKDWKSETVDKRIVKVQCPKCQDINCPLIRNPLTVEIEKKKYGKKMRLDREVVIKYGTKCKKCNEPFRFNLICKGHHYAKLGIY